ncbi:CBS and ACT domain-containing protein [Selenomonas sputigena]|uniref:CBS and ACT domain-containing protein n=1 Tax=Selenomonas sputigena TaxID=69823 RepID=A0ABV3X453_9FIRM
MFVANRMAKNPITVTPETKVDAARELMKKHHFRRLPVVDEDGRLVGFLSDRDIMRVSPSPATTLSRYEITSLLAKMRIEDIMQKNVVSVNEDATIEEAALIMYNHKIGGLPVISSVGVVVGVITETDIFKTFVDVMGLTHGKTRFTIADVGDKVGVVRDLAGAISDCGCNIDSLVTCQQEDGNYEIVVRFDTADSDAVRRKLEEKGFHVAHVVKIG